jgi:hypothetical protein
MPSGPNFASGMAQLFGTNNNFTATLNMSVGGMTLSGTFYASGIKSRMDISTSGIQGLPLAMSVISRMQESGLDHYSAVSRPDQGIDMLVFPGLNGYITTPSRSANFISTNMQLTVTDNGTTTLNGHTCAIETVQMTNARGQTRTFTVWYALDFSNFPIQISTAAPGESGITVSFTNITLGGVDDSQFGFPTGYKRFYSPEQILLEMLSTAPTTVTVPADGIIR